MVEGGFSYGWWRKGCIVDCGGRDVLWVVEDGLSYEWLWKGYIVNGCIVDNSSRVVLWVEEGLSCGC